MVHIEATGKKILKKTDVQKYSIRAVREYT